MKGKPKRTYVLWALFTVYCLLLLWVILFKTTLSLSQLDRFRGINLIPFHYDREVSGHGREVLENVILFVPMGMFLSALRVPGGTAAGIGALTSLALEAAQYLFRLGASDITDLIANTAGTVIGIGIFALTAQMLRRRERAERAVAFLVAVCTVGVLVLAALLYHYN